jgi:hypothetical protein
MGLSYKIIFHVKFLATFMVHLQTKLYMAKPNGSLVITIKLKAKQALHIITNHHHHRCTLTFTIIKATLFLGTLSNVFMCQQSLKSGKAAVRFVMSVHPISPSTCNLSPAVQIFVTFYMGHFY